MDLGYYSELSIGDIKDEIFDMVKPKDPLCITLQELIDCKVGPVAPGAGSGRPGASACVRWLMCGMLAQVGGTIMTMMADVAIFWNYDNRESLMQHDEDEDDQ